MIKTRPPSFKEVAISDIAKDFILKCLVYSPIKRISWRDLYDHPLIKAKPATNMMLYGLTSRIDFGENKKFYENGPNINKYTM